MNREGRGLLRKAAELVGLVDARQLSTDHIWAVRPGTPILPAVPVEASRGSGKDEATEGFYRIADGVATIEVRGTLSKHPSIMRALGCSSAATLPEIALAVKDAAYRRDVDSIELLCDSPGGSAAGTTQVADAVWEARQQKRVTAFVVDECCSAAYEIASQADEIVSGDAALVGSIGTYATILDTSAAATNAGVVVHIVSSGGVKGALADGTEVTDEALEEVQRVVTSLNDVFVSRVARGRGITEAQARKLADGRCHVGQDALALGLIDRLEAPTTAAPRGKEDEMSDENEVAAGANTPQPNANSDAQALAEAQKVLAEAKAIQAENEKTRVALAVEKDLQEHREKMTPAALASEKNRSTLMQLKAAGMDEAYETFLQALCSVELDNLTGGAQADGQDSSGDHQHAGITLSARDVAFLKAKGQDADRILYLQQAYQGSLTSNVN